MTHGYPQQIEACADAGRGQQRDPVRGVEDWSYKCGREQCSPVWHFPGNSGLQALQCHNLKVTGAWRTLHFIMPCHCLSPSCHDPARCTPTGEVPRPYTFLGRCSHSLCIYMLMCVSAHARLVSAPAVNQGPVQITVKCAHELDTH